MLRILLLTVGVVFLVVVVVVAIGYLLPVAHAATRERVIAASADRVFSLIADVPRYADWRADVTKVEVLSTTPLRWRESGGNGDITYVAVVSHGPSRFVTRIDDPSLPFGGTWTFDLTPDGAGTRVRITEEGQVFNPLFRFMSRFIFGHTRTIDTYLSHLAARAARTA